MLLQSAAYANTCSETPLETAILKLPDNGEVNWKEISRYVSKKNGVIETIPLNQTIKNWSELICVQYIDHSGWNKNVVHTIENVLERVRKQTLSSFPENIVTWHTIEKNEDGIIYEWALHQPYNNISPQHEIARAFLTPSGFHRVGFTRKNGQMCPEEREKWIKLLRENSSVVSFQEGKTFPGLSLVEKLNDSVSLGPNFLNWKRINTFAFENGYTIISYIPPTQVVPYVTECLESVTMPNVNEATLAQLFEVEKKCIRERADRKVPFQVLEQSPSEVIYTYCHPRDHLQCNAVVRTFLTDHGYYSIIYKHGLTRHMKKEEILKWQEKLKSICIKTPLKGQKQGFEAVGMETHFKE